MLKISNNRNIWPHKFSIYSIFITIFVLFLLNAAYFKYITPPLLFLLIIFVTLYFFLALNHYTLNWQELSPSLFYKKIFRNSILYRFCFLGLSYLVTWVYDPASLPFEIAAADSKAYYQIGRLLTDNFINGKFIPILSLYWLSQSDWGFSIYLGLVNTLFFNSVFMVKIFNIILGSYTVVLLAKIAEQLYSFNHARLTGIIAMLLPSLMWFNAKYLKETVMIFIIIIVIYNAVMMISKEKIKISSILILLFGSSSLFYFRTAIAVLLILSLSFSFIVLLATRKKIRAIPFVLSLIFIIGTYFISTKYIGTEEIDTQFSQIDGASEKTLSTKIEKVGGLNLKTQLAIPLVMANSIVSPYPSFLDIDKRQIGIIAHAPNEVTRIIIYYFAFLGVFILLKNDFRNSALILSFGLGYVLLISITGLSYSDRFQLPAVPFMIILISVGFINSSKKWFSNWKIYLVLIWGAIIFWHIFKMNIRGL